MPALLWLGGEACALDSAAEAGGSTLLQELTSPYRNERRRAREEFLRGADASALTALAGHEDPGVRRAAAQLLAERPEWIDPAAVAGWLGGESSAAVLDPLVAAVLRAGPIDVTVARRWLQGLQDPAVSSLLLQRLVLGRTQLVFEDVMSEESVPGFYDGQFAAFWPIAADMAERLIQISRDEQYHFVIRVLAVMALHESKRDTLPEDLAPLLMDAREEFIVSRDAMWQPRPRSGSVVLERRRADLSRYARYSLAKAGFTDPILAYIREMDRELRAYESLMQGGSPLQEDNSNEQFLREWLQGLLFETGYYFQQFDDYEGAKRRYLRLVERYPESRSCQNAYYNLACIAAIQGQVETALDFLESAVNHGFSDHEWLQEDGDLTVLRGHPKFLRILELARTGQFTAGGRDLGTAWLSKLRQFIPPGRSFFDLTAADQEAVLVQGAGLLTPAEWRLLLDSAPAATREGLEEIGRRLQARGLLRRN